MNEETVDYVLYALSHASRRKILDIVKENPGCNVNAIARHFDTTRIAIMKHLKILQDADLLLSEKQGRSRLFYQNLVPIQLIYDRWTDKYGGFWAGQLADIKYKVEREKQ